MKKSLLFLCCIMTLLSSCSNDDLSQSGNDSNSTSQKIKWYGTKTAETNSSTSTTRGVADEGNLWNQRVGIYIKFLNSPQDSSKLEQVKKIASEWERYAGIKFYFVNGDAKANVRIGFDWQGNDWLTWSYTGTDAKLINDQTQPTAVLAGAEYSTDEEFRGDVLRLFGQILGLEYEQRHQDWSFWRSEIQLQRYWESMFEGMNMDWDQIREYVFVPLTAENGVHTVQTDEIDELSIMAWPYYTRTQTTKLIANYKLSPTDKTFIGKLYPKDGVILPTIQEAWVDAGLFTWNENKTGLYRTGLALELDTLPDVSDGEQLTTVESMFSFSPKLKKAPYFNTSNVTNFSTMFRQCEALEEIPVYNTSKGTNFGGMFAGCYILKEVPLFDTSNGTDFDLMFSSCQSLTKVPLFDTSNGTNFGSMFAGCDNLPEVPLFDTSNGTVFYSMFTSCYNLTEVPLFNTSNGTDFSWMFFDCKSLKTKPDLDLSNAVYTDKMYVGTPFENM